VIVGLPDTVWFPQAALAELPDDGLSFLLFPVERPEFFDAVVLDETDRVREIQVKRVGAASRWIWGAFRMPGAIFAELHQLWQHRDRRDEYFGTLVNAYVDAGGHALGIKAGTAYVDVGTLNGYREAMHLLGAVSAGAHPDSGGARVTLGWPDGCSLQPTASSSDSLEPPCHARPCAGHPRLGRRHGREDVDGRDKPGHDSESSSKSVETTRTAAGETPSTPQRAPRGEKNGATSGEPQPRAPWPPFAREGQT
jgi:hypothetical protein